MLGGMNKRARSVLGALSIAAVAGFILSSLVTVATPVELTNTAITESFSRMRMFLALHRRFPESLDDLPKREGHANRTADGWGRPLMYRIEGSNYITLLSLGEDGRVGGTGVDADIRKTYRTKSPDGSWCVDDEMWIVTEEMRGIVEKAPANEWLSETGELP